VKPKEVKKGPDTREWAETVNRERLIRVSVKRTGGWRANIHEDSIKAGVALMAEDKGWSRRGKDRGQRTRTEKDGWDTSIHIPGYDNTDHAGNQRSLKDRDK